MRIDRDYVITTDGSRNIILNQRVYKPIYREAQNGKGETTARVIDHYEPTDKFKPIGYYSKLEYLYDSIIDKQLIISGMKDLEQIMAALEEVRECVKNIAIMKQKELNTIKEDME